MIDLFRLEDTWLRAGAAVLVADTNGVVILSSLPLWKYTAVTALTPALLTDIARTRQYNQRPIGAFPLPVRGAMGDEAPREVTFSADMLRRNAVPFAPGAYLLLTRKLPETGWRLMLFSGVQAVRRQALTQGALGAAAAGLILLGLGLLSQRRRYYLTGCWPRPGWSAPTWSWRGR